MKIAIYGLPQSGKDHLINNLKGILHVRGSDWLLKMSDDRFNDLSSTDKTQLRRAFIDHINSLDVEHIVVDGHYSFPNYYNGYDVVFTENDGDCYDAFLYLDTSSNIISERLQLSEKNFRFRKLSLEDLDAWKRFEIEGLRKECIKRNKDFILLDSDVRACEEFISHVLRRTPFGSSIKAAELIVQEICEKSDRCENICLLDCDRTLSSNDLTYKFLEYSQIDSSFLNENFCGNSYSSYQFWKVASRYSKVKKYNSICEKVSENVILNNELINDVKRIQNCFFVGLTSGLYDCWESIRLVNDFPDIVFGGSNIITDNWVVSDLVKGFVAKLLRQKGKKVIAVGDSMGDILMLNQANHAYVIANTKISYSLEDHLINNAHSIKQPTYNTIRFRSVPMSEGIYEDIIG